MINVNRKIEDFLHKKAGYKDFHIPQNMSFTTSSDWESTRIFLSLDKIANQKPEDLDFESWVILLEASGFARIVELDLSLLAKKEVEEFYAAEWVAPGANYDEFDIFCFLERIDKFRKSGFPFTASPFLESHALDKDLGQRKFLRALMGKVFDQYLQNRIVVEDEKLADRTKINIDVQKSIGEVSDIYKVFSYATDLDKQTAELTVFPTVEVEVDVKARAEHVVKCQINSGDNPVLNNNLQDIVALVNSLPTNVEFVTEKNKEACQETEDNTKKEIEERLRLKTGAEDLQLPDNLTLKFVPSNREPKLIMTIEESSPVEMMAREGWKRLLLSYGIAAQVQINVVNHELLQVSKHTGCRNEEVNHNLYVIDRYIHNAFCDGGIVLDCKPEKLSKSIGYPALRIDDKFKFQIVSQQKKLQRLNPWVSEEEKIWTNQWEVKVIGQAIIKDITDYAAAMFYMDHIRKIVYDAKADVEMKYGQDGWLDKERKFDFTISTEIHCKTTIETGMKPHDSIFNRLIKDWGI